MKSAALDADQWLKDNAFHCIRLDANISKLGCDMYRAENQNKIINRGTKTSPLNITIPGYCQGCSQADGKLLEPAPKRGFTANLYPKRKKKQKTIKKVEKLAPEITPEPIAKEDKMAEKKTGECIGPCGRKEIVIIGRGLCSKCYYHARKAEKTAPVKKENTDNEIVTLFIKESCVIGDCEISLLDIYASYKNWFCENPKNKKDKPLNNVKFFKTLDNFRTESKGGQTYIQGISLIEKEPIQETADINDVHDDLSIHIEEEDDADHSAIDPEKEKAADAVMEKMGIKENRPISGLHKVLAGNSENFSGRFSIECCTFNPSFGVFFSDLYRCYEKWWKTNNVVSPMSKKQFMPYVLEYIKVVAGRTIVTGMSLKDKPQVFKNNVLTDLTEKEEAADQLDALRDYKASEITAAKIGALPKGPFIGLDEVPFPTNFSELRGGERIIIQRCRECGCTEIDCSVCIEKTGQPCYWVEPDLCSACVPNWIPCDLNGEILGAYDMGMYAPKPGEQVLTLLEETEGALLDDLTVLEVDNVASVTKILRIGDREIERTTVCKNQSSCPSVLRRYLPAIVAPIVISALILIEPAQWRVCVFAAIQVGALFTILESCKKKG